MDVLWNLVLLVVGVGVICDYIRQSRNRILDNIEEILLNSPEDPCPDRHCPFKKTP